MINKRRMKNRRMSIQVINGVFLTVLLVGLISCKKETNQPNNNNNNTEIINGTILKLIVTDLGSSTKSAIKYQWDYFDSKGEHKYIYNTSTSSDADFYDILTIKDIDFDKKIYLQARVGNIWYTPDGTPEFYPSECHFTLEKDGSIIDSKVTKYYSYIKQ